MFIFILESPYKPAAAFPQLLQFHCQPGEKQVLGNWALLFFFRKNLVSAGKGSGSHIVVPQLIPENRN